MTDAQTTTPREHLEDVLATGGGKAASARTVAAAALLIREGLDNLAEAIAPRELTAEELLGPARDDMAGDE